MAKHRRAKKSREPQGAGGHGAHPTSRSSPVCSARALVARAASPGRLRSRSRAVGRRRRCRMPPILLLDGTAGGLVPPAIPSDSASCRTGTHRSPLRGLVLGDPVPRTGAYTMRTPTSTVVRGAGFSSVMRRGLLSRASGGSDCLGGSARRRPGSPSSTGESRRKRGRCRPGRPSDGHNGCSPEPEAVARSMSRPSPALLPSQAHGTGPPVQDGGPAPRA